MSKQWWTGVERVDDDIDLKEVFRVTQHIESMINTMVGELVPGFEMTIYLKQGGHGDGLECEQCWSTVGIKAHYDREEPNE